MMSPSLPGGTSAASAVSSSSGCSPRSGASVSPAHCRTTPPLLTAPPTIHRRAHLVRAALEGVCLQLALVLASMREAGNEVREIRATGGFARSSLWRAILAGIFGRPIGFAASPEGSALGAALLGMTSLGMLESLDRAAELVAVTHVERPDADEAEAYARLLPHFEAAYAAVSRTSAALTDLQDVLPVAPQPQPGDT